MHKRGYDRYTQEERAWVRVAIENDSENDSLALVGRKATRWTSGNRRDRETRVLAQHSTSEFKKLMLQTFLRSNDLLDNEASSSQIMQLSHKLSKINRMHSLSRSKNSCALSGKGRTFNRFLFVSRQTLRTLTRCGIISGLISGKRG